MSRKTYAYTTGTLGSPTDIDSYTYYDQWSEVVWGDGLKSYNGSAAFTYDGIGNPLTYNNGSAYTFSWNNGRQLASGTKGSTSFAYTYNSDGLRTRKVVGSKTYDYYWFGSRLVMMTITSGSSVTTLKFYYDANGLPIIFDYNGTQYHYITNLQGDVVGLANEYGIVATYAYDAWGKIISTSGASSMEESALAANPLRYRGYIYDNETGFYYLQSRYYDPEIGRFLNADNNFSNYNLFMYCGNNPVNRIDPNGEHWYYLWIDDLIEAVDELMASVSNIVYGRAAYERSYYDPKGANDLWNSRPFQDTKPSQEMQIFTEFMYDHDFVADISVSVDTPIKNTYVKVGASKVLSPNKNINASYVHAGIGESTPSVLPINISYSVGIVKGVNAKENYAKHFLDIGAGAIYGFDYCWWPNGASAYSFTIGTSYGVYGGYDYYWCLD